MADVTNEPIYEVLKQMQDRASATDRKLDEIKGEMQAIRSHVLGMQQDVQNIYAVLARRDGRLDRIERRLDISETV